MIPARKFPLGEWLVTHHLIERSIRKNFDRVHFRMRSPYTAEQRRLPMIICANHSSWWDGYMAVLIEKHLDIDGYLMMEEAQLSRYFFFRWAGCFSVDRRDARSAMASVQYAAQLLKQRAGRMVWLFPQGEIRPNDYRPLTFFSGAAHLARQTCPALLYPLAIRIEYLAEQHPDLFMSMGEPLLVTSAEVDRAGFNKTCTRELEQRVTRELDQLHDDVTASNLATFTLLLRGKTSTNRIFDSLLLRKQIDRHE